MDSPTPYCFIKPTKEPLVGEIKYPNEEMIAMGLKEGDRIAYQPDSDYVFEVEGKNYSECTLGNLTLKWN